VYKISQGLGNASACPFICHDILESAVKPVGDVTSPENGTSALCATTLTCVPTAIRQERQEQASIALSILCSALTLICSPNSHRPSRALFVAS